MTIPYGKDGVCDFGDLLVRAQRDNGKMRVRDVQRDITRRHEVKQEQAVKHQRKQWIERGPGLGR